MSSYFEGKISYNDINRINYHLFRESCYLCYLASKNMLTGNDSIQKTKESIKEYIIFFIGIIYFLEKAEISLENKLRGKFNCEDCAGNHNKGYC